MDNDALRDGDAEELVAFKAENPPEEFDALLDYACAEIDSGRVAEGMGTLYLGLYGHPRSMSARDWEDQTRRARTGHALASRVYQSPFTRRAYEKPRGYAGDAQLIDLIYEWQGTQGLTALGEDIHMWERRSPGCRGVRARRDLLAQALSYLPTTTKNPRVMSIACGHLREALGAHGVKDGAIAEFVALDQDEESLKVVTGYGIPSIRAEHQSVKDVLMKRNRYRDFDFVYAAGLFDYLPDNVGRALTTAMFRMLRPGGRCWIANFAPDMVDIGYMDAFMDWRLIYRDEAQLVSLTEGINPSELFSRRVFREPNDCIVFCELVRG